MTKGQRRNLKFVLAAICCAWVAGAGWVMFSAIPESEIQHHGSEAVKERMRECEGTFKQRYDCKEAIVIESGRETFRNMTTRLAVVTVPAILFGILGSLVIRHIPIDKPPPPPVDLDWKSRAQAHIHQPHSDGDQASGQS